MRVLVETRQVAFGPLGTRVIHVGGGEGDGRRREQQQQQHYAEEEHDDGGARTSSSFWSFASVPVGGSLTLATNTDNDDSNEDDRVLTWHLDSHLGHTTMQLAEASVSRGPIGAPVELRFAGQAFASAAAGVVDGVVWLVMLLEDRRVAWVRVPAAPHVRGGGGGATSVLDVLASSSSSRGGASAAVRFAALPAAVADVGVPTCLTLAGRSLCVAGTSDSVAVLPLDALLQHQQQQEQQQRQQQRQRSPAPGAAVPPPGFDLSADLVMLSTGNWLLQRLASTLHLQRQHQLGAVAAASAGYKSNGGSTSGAEAEALVLLHSDGTARAWDVASQQQLGGTESLAPDLHVTGGGRSGSNGGASAAAPPCRLRRACVVAGGGGNDACFLVELVPAAEDGRAGSSSGGGAGGDGNNDGTPSGGGGNNERDSGALWVLVRLSASPAQPGGSGKLAVVERVRLSPPSPDLQVSSACLLPAGAMGSSPTLVAHAIMPEGGAMMMGGGGGGGSSGDDGGGGAGAGATPRVLAFDASDGSFQGRAHLLQQPGGLGAWTADQDLWAAAVRGEADAFVLGQLLSPGAQMCRASLLDALERFAGGGGGGFGGGSSSSSEREQRRQQQLAELCASDARALAQRVRAAVAQRRARDPAGGGAGATVGTAAAAASSSDARLWHLFFAAYAEAWARRHPALGLASARGGAWVGVLRGGPQLSVLRPASRPEALLHAHPRLLAAAAAGGGAGGGSARGPFRSRGERAVHSALRALRGALGKPALRAMTRAVIAGEQGGDLMLLVPRFVDLLVYGPGAAGGAGGAAAAAAAAAGSEPGAARRLAQWRERRRQALVAAREALADVESPLDAVAEAVEELEREERVGAVGEADVPDAASAAAAHAAASAAVAAALQAARARASLAQQLLLLLGVAVHHSGALGRDPLGPDGLRRAEGDLPSRLALVLRGSAATLWACRSPCSARAPAPLAWGDGSFSSSSSSLLEPPPLAAQVLPGFLRANPRLAASMMRSSAGVGEAGAALARWLSAGPPVAAAGAEPGPPSPADSSSPDTAAARALRLAYRLYLAREFAALDALCALAGPGAQEDPGLRLLRGLAAARGVRARGDAAAAADAAAGLLFRAAAALGTPSGLVLRDLLARLERRRAQDDGDVAAVAHAEAAAAKAAAEASAAGGAGGGGQGATPLAQVEYHEAVARLFAREGCPEAALAFCRAAVALVPRAFPAGGPGAAGVDAEMEEEEGGQEEGGDATTLPDAPLSAAGRERASALWSAALGHAIELGRIREAYDAAVAIPLPRRRADAVQRVVRAAASAARRGGGGGSSGGSGDRLADLCALPLAGAVRLPSSSSSGSGVTTELVPLLRLALDALTERALSDDGLALAQAGGADGSPHAVLHAFCVRWGAPRPAAAAALALARRLRAVARPGPAAHADVSRAYDAAAAALGALPPADAWLDEDEPLLKAAAAAAAAGGGAGGNTPPSGGRMAAAAAAAAAAARKRGPADVFGGDAVQSPPGTRDVLSPSSWARGGGGGGSAAGGGGASPMPRGPDAHEMADQLLRALQPDDGGATTAGGAAPVTPTMRTLAKAAPAATTTTTARSLAREAALFRAAAALAPRLPGLDALRLPGPPADYLLDQLLACGLFDEALELAPAAWAGDASALAPRLARCVSAVAAACVRLQQRRPALVGAAAARDGASAAAAAADAGQLARPREGATYLGPAFLSSPAAAAWDRLRALLERLDGVVVVVAAAGGGGGGGAGTTATAPAATASSTAAGRQPPTEGGYLGRLRLAAAEAILSEGGPAIELPPWLLASLDGLGSGGTGPASAAGAGASGGAACFGGMAGGSADPSALLRLYLRHGRLAAAAALVLDHLAAWQRRGPLERARGAACWFPWRQVGELCAALERRGGAGAAELSVLRSRLVAAVDAHLRLAASDSAVAGSRPAVAGGGGDGLAAGGGGGGAGGLFLLGAA
jgi:hypothetical protein